MKQRKKFSNALQNKKLTFAVGSLASAAGWAYFYFTLFAKKTGAAYWFDSEKMDRNVQQVLTGISISTAAVLTGPIFLKSIQAVLSVSSMMSQRVCPAKSMPNSDALGLTTQALEENPESGDRGDDPRESEKQSIVRPNQSKVKSHSHFRRASPFIASILLCGAAYFLAAYKIQVPINNDLFNGTDFIPDSNGTESLFKFISDSDYGMYGAVASSALLSAVASGVLFTAFVVCAANAKSAFSSLASSVVGCLNFNQRRGYKEQKNNENNDEENAVFKQMI